MEVSVPGKLILMGEHSVVYGHPAVVAGLGRRATVRVRKASGSGRVTLSLPDLDWRQQLDRAALESYRARFADLWQRFADDPSSTPFARVRGADDGHVVKIACGEAICRLARAGAGSASDLTVTVRSEIPVGSGFGSSAAVAAGTAAALSLLCRGSVDEAAVDEVTRETERRQHGLPSGVDAAAVLRGGFLFARPEGDMLHLRPLGPGRGAAQRIRVFDSGRPAETTGDVVAGVRERRVRSPKRFDRILARMGELTRTFATGVERGESGLDALVREFHARLVELGVVPAGIRRAIDELEARGGTAKISGAGTLSDGPAGCLIAFHNDASVVERWADAYGFSAIRARVGVEGWRVERMDGQAA